MLTLELSIRSQTQAALPVHARFVIGESAQAWIDEIVRWNVDDHMLRMIVVPRSRRDLKPIGVLIFNRDGSPLHVPKHCVSTNAVPYGVLGSQVYLPCDATFEPAISQQELAQHLTRGRTYVWHPTSGLVAADVDDLMSVSDLFSKPEQTSEPWGQAICGTAWAQQLTSVALLPEANPSANEALAGGMDNIGSKADDIESIDPIEDPDGKTDEPKNSPLNKAVDAGVKGVAKFVQGAAGMVPAGASDYTWVNKLEDWAGGKLEGLREKLEQQRFKELFRLQRLLEQNPEEGLKYALPLNSNELNRGTSLPGSRLTERQTNFSLSGLRGGGPADYWDVPDDLRTTLNRQYRELAEREINLGRYRRAAYIYGQLLADLNAAARTLETGKHYREAAVLYRTKLRRDVDAARCLDKGGLWSELIALREELKQYEMAGDVYVKLGLEDQAKVAFKKAVNKQLGQQNYTDAARIEEHKLKDVDATLKVLAKSWPSSEQSNLCLQATFRVLGDAGRHADSRDWIARVENEFQSAKSQPDVLLTVASLANTYPDQATRELAHESTFRIASAELTDRPNLGWVFLSSINELHPEDKLLTRDCSKFKSQLSHQKVFPAPKRLTNSEKEIALVTTFELSKNFGWVDGINLGRGYLLIGQKNQHVTMAKLSADFKTLGKQSARLSNSTKASFSIAKTTDNQRVIVHCPLDERFDDQEIFATDESPQATMVGGSWIDSATIGFAQYAYQKWIAVRLTDDDCLIELLSGAGGIKMSRPVPFDFRELTIPVPISHDETKVYVALGNEIWVVMPDGKLDCITFDERIRSIRSSVRGTRSRTVLAFEKGVQVSWSDEQFGKPRLICADMIEPETLFTRTGHLVVAADHRCEVYKTAYRQVQFVAAFDIESCVRLMRTKESNQFAVLTESGKICVYQIPM